MRSKLLYTYLLTMGVLAALLAGCGGGGGTTSSGPVNALHESTACISCHDSTSWLTPGTGKPLVAEWMNSSHMIANGAGCGDCHDDGYMHPASCTKCHNVGAAAMNPSPNPDQDGKCAKCHDMPNPRPGKPDGFKPLTYSDPLLKPGTTTAYTHFSSGRHGMYVATNYVNYCRKCHDPHDTTFGQQQRKDWAESGHGTTTAGYLVSSTDFKTRGSALPMQDNFGAYCVRCHTSTGHINFISADPRDGKLFSNVQALPDYDGRRSNYPGATFTYQDKTRETTNCDVCHTDGNPSSGSSYSGRLRTVPPIPVWYLYSSHPIGAPLIRAKMQVQFDSLGGGSNTCMVCHSGRETGDIIKVADRLGLFSYTGTTNTTRPSGITPHDFSAGANLQGKSGFNYYTSSARYVTAPMHKTASDVIGGANGSCVGCHMRNDRPHLFQPVTWLNGDISATITAVPSNPAVCIKCHVGAKPQITPAYMNSQRDNYRAAVVALGTMVPANRDWKFWGNAVVPGSGPGPGYTGGDAIRAGAYTMAVNYVYSLFFNDPGAYTHNPTYTKQQIYDSIDWIADGKMDYGTAGSQIVTRVNAVTATLYWTKSTVNYGQNGVVNGTPLTKVQALTFICKDYDPVNSPSVCNRW